MSMDEFDKMLDGIIDFDAGKKRKNEASRKHYYKLKHSNKDKLKHWNKKNSMKYKYGITEEEYDVMMKNQDYRCAICGENKKLVIDHDNNELVIRGLLCSLCNIGIGALGHSVSILLKAARYIASPPAVTKTHTYKIPKKIVRKKK